MPNIGQVNMTWSSTMSMALEGTSEGAKWRDMWIERVSDFSHQASWSANYIVASVFIVVVDDDIDDGKGLKYKTERL